MRQVIPDLNKAQAHWKRRCSDIPDYIEVPMSDNRIVRYYPEVGQPGYVAVMESVRRCIGYEMKRPAAVAATEPAQKK